MASFAFQVVSLNGVALTGSPYQVVFFKVENGPLGTRANNPVYAGITGKGSRRVRGQPSPSVFRLRVALSSLQQADLKTAHAVFNELDGSVYLRVTDGDGVVWRLEVAVRNVEPISTNMMDVVLDVPDQVWETDTAVSDNQSNKTASPIALGAASLLTNAGDRDTAPVFTINVDASKSTNSALDDYPWSAQVIMVNRSPNDLDNVPVWLMDQSGAAARPVTDSGAAGLMAVRQTTGASVLTADPGAGGTTIAVAATDAFNSNGGMAILQWVTGSTFGTMECIYYTGRSTTTGAGNLTGCVRGIGGTTAQAHGIGTAIAVCATMPNGDDVRVTLDDVPNVNRWLVNWNGTASDVVIVTSFKRAVPVTATVAATASVPANGASITFQESLALWAQADGYFMWENEVFHYDTRDDHTVYGIVRAAWGTTAASHATSATVYPNPRRAIVQAGYAKAGAPPSPPAERPCMQLKGSSNQTWKYGDQSDDALTIYYDPLNPNRASMWVPGFDLDGNTVSPLMSLSAYGNILTFKDDVPGDGNPPYNNLELSIPMGLKTADVNAIKNDWTPTTTQDVLNLELWTRDAQSVLKLQDQLQQSGAAAARALPVALTNIAYGLKLKARYNVITGWRTTVDAIVTTITNAAATFPTAGMVAVRFDLTGERQPNGLALRLAKTAAGNQDVTCTIVKDTSGLPDVTMAGRVSSLGTKNINGTTPTLYYWPFGPRTLNKTGTYWAIFLLDTAGFASVNVYGANSFLSINQRIRLAKEVGAVWAATDLITPELAPWFEIFGTYDASGNALLEPDMPVGVPAALGGFTRTATTASFDKTELILSTTQSIYVHRLSAFVTGATAGNMHHLKGTIASTTTGESGVLDVWVRPNGIVTIDCDARTIVKTEDTIDTPIGSAFSGSFITLVPGDNTVTYQDVSLKSPGQIDVQTLFRSRKA